MERRRQVGRSKVRPGADRRGQSEVTGSRLVPVELPKEPRGGKKHLPEINAFF